MKVSQKGLNLIKEFEGCYLKAYKDSVGVLTIGWGTTNYDTAITGLTIKSNTTITQKQADEFLEKSVNQKYVPAVERQCSYMRPNQNQIDALVSFCYNLGEGSLRQLTANKTRTQAEVSAHITAYNKAGGKVLAGLTRRRNAEKALFDTPYSEPEPTPVPEEIINIPFFDTELYNGLYEDLRNAFGGNPKELIKHYKHHGIAEGRIGSYIFNPQFYGNKYDDLKSAFGDNAEALYNHYESFGLNEGRQASELFDPQFYLANYEDLRNVYGDNYKGLQEHFLAYGIHEGRVASNEFNVHNYRAKNEDLDKAYGDNWKMYFWHYVACGRLEGRICV